jgi:hypothetical protein
MQPIHCAIVRCQSVGHAGPQSYKAAGGRCPITHPFQVEHLDGNTIALPQALIHLCKRRT